MFASEHLQIIIYVETRPKMGAILIPCGVAENEEVLRTRLSGENLKNYPSRLVQSVCSKDNLSSNSDFQRSLRKHDKENTPVFSESL